MLRWLHRTVGNIRVLPLASMLTQMLFFLPFPLSKDQDNLPPSGLSSSLLSSSFTELDPCLSLGAQYDSSCTAFTSLSESSLHTPPSLSFPSLARVTQWPLMSRKTSVSLSQTWRERGRRKGRDIKLIWPICFLCYCISHGDEKSWQ